MKSRGYSTSEIAKKTGLSYEYVAGVIRLLENGEERLLRAVESGMMPISVAVDIADAEDGDVQAALQAAYESKLLRGRKLLAARRLVIIDHDSIGRNHLRKFDLLVHAVPDAAGDCHEVPLDQLACGDEFRAHRVLIAGAKQHG